MSNLPNPQTQPTELATVPREVLPVLRPVQAGDVYAALLADARCQSTRNARKYDIEIFGRFLSVRDPATACALFLGLGRSRANAVATAFRSHEQARGQSPASINRAQATLRRLLKLARRYEVIEYEVEFDALKVTRARDRRGPGVDGWRLLWKAALAAGDGPHARQDRAILRLLHDQALRKAEVVGLDVADVDLGRPAVAIRGKGFVDKEWVTINAPTATAIEEWLAVRGVNPGPLFMARPNQGRRRPRKCMGLRQQPPPPASRLRLSELIAMGFRDDGHVAILLNREGHRMAHRLKWRAYDVKFHGRVATQYGTARRIVDRSINRMIKDLADQAGIKQAVRPHGLRHAGITRALDLTKGDIRKVQRFARHTDPKTTMLYDDDRQDFAGQVARMLGDDG